MAIVESYLNRYGHPDPVETLRYWVHPSILVGGNVNDEADWRHLHDDLGIRSVLNVDHITDVGKGITYLAECPVPDDGTPLPRGLVRHAVSFARYVHGFGPIYVHCHVGMSRSPAFAYAILRWVHDVGPDQALELVRSNGTPFGYSYGNFPKQRAYLDAIEAAFRDLP